MGQAWCKERTTKAQDSKSPLDRVFVRCAHQIYPTLKQDGSVLGGATQRVTSSEIGYAGSPPREALTRGQSVDSIDRPFHPSEWVDVNLEVPSTPSSVITNLTANTSLYPTTTTSSTASNLKNITPIPPPRRRRKNRGRPLPPKPDEIIETHGKGKPGKKDDEPLYSSVKSQKFRDAKLQVSENTEPSQKVRNSNNGVKGNDEDKENRRNGQDKVETKEIREHKMNGTGRILAMAEVTAAGNLSLDSGEPKEQSRYEKDMSVKLRKNNNNNEEYKDPEYERFSKSEELRSSSTPKVPERESSSGKDLCNDFVSGRILGDEDDILNVVYHRSKTYSTVSLPNYDELEVVKQEVEREPEILESEVATPKKPGRLRNLSTSSLPMPKEFESLPQETKERLEKYMTRCRSFGSLQPEEILDKLKAQVEQIDSDEDDEWGGLDDWDLGVAEYGEPCDGRSPLEPSSRLRERKGTILPKFVIGGDEVNTTEETKSMDARKEPDSSGEDKAAKKSLEALVSEKKPMSEISLPTIPRNASFEIPKSPNSLKSALKAQANRKISMPTKLASEKPSSPLEDWFSAQERSVRFFDVPKLEEEYANTPGHRPAKPSDVQSEPEYDTRSYPFNGMPTGPLNIDTFFGEGEEDFGGTTTSGDTPGPRERPKNLTRSLSNESEPFDGCEEKELTLETRPQVSSLGKLSRTISDESIPPEMVEEVDDSLVKTESSGSATRKSQDSKTPPPSPEPKIEPEIQGENHRPTTLKIQREEEGESNLSSMTPSLTELEAALSDMLEKEELEEPRPEPEHVEDSENSNLRHTPDDKPIEPKIVPQPGSEDPEKGNLLVRRRKQNVKISLGEILNDSPESKIVHDVKATEKIFKGEGGGDKIRGTNPFDDSDEEGLDISKVPFSGTASRPLNPFDGEPPEKPSRLHKIPLDQSNAESGPDMPTPPQRKNKPGAVSPTTKTDPGNMESEFPIRDSTPHPNDRLI